MKISYAVTVFNELEEIKRLLNFLFTHKRKQDEIVVLMDNKGPKEVWDYLISIESQLGVLNRLEFGNHFANWKNTLNKMCSGDFIFQIDADEIPHENLIINLHYIIDQNPSVDLYLVPRVNIVNNITEEHIGKWGWKINEKGWINWPDYQWRIYRNKPEIKWKNKVHEVLDGYKEFAYLPTEEEWSLYHPKSIEKQEKQNNFYTTL